jgi:hypothetical protein
MSEVELGCFGKLPFAELDRLQRVNGVTHAYWADALPVPAILNGICSIDTVAISPSHLVTSVTIGILHALNDIYAAGGIPRSFSVSLTVPSETDTAALFEIGRAISECASMTKCTLGKLHTNRRENNAIMTTCAIGSRCNTATIVPVNGSVWLLDELKDVSNTIVDSNNAAISRRLFVRELAATRISGPMKDVSGDGMAGAIYQLCVRHKVSITLFTNVLSTLIGYVALDSCNQDRNYNDYYSYIEGFADQNTSRMRHVLFEPQLFGPLVCLVDGALDLREIQGVQIGSFASGQASIRLKHT